MKLTLTIAEATKFIGKAYMLALPSPSPFEVEILAAAPPQSNAIGDYLGAQAHTVMRFDNKEADGNRVAMQVEATGILASYPQVKEFVDVMYELKDVFSARSTPMQTPDTPLDEIDFSGLK